MTARARGPRPRRNVLPASMWRQFDSFLADLSEGYASVPADRLDEEINAGLRRIVEFLGIDRSGLGQRLHGGGLAITHSYQVPGVPPTPKVPLDAHFPVYARKIEEGRPFRLPDDVEGIEDAVAERVYFAKSRLKSQLTIPLLIGGAVVGGIGFASFRSRVEWPEAVVIRLRRIGEVFAHALARKQAHDLLQAARQQAEVLRDELARATDRLRKAVREARQPDAGGSADLEEMQRARRMLDLLTPREREVFLLAAAGVPSKAIAERLRICLQTVKFHRGRLMRKLQVDSAAALGYLAHQANLRPPPTSPA